jgi:hypothetical protein
MAKACRIGSVDAMDTAPDLRNVAVRLTLEAQELTNLLRFGRRTQARTLAQRIADRAQALADGLGDD